MAERPSGRVDRPVNSLADLRLSSETLDSVLGHIRRVGLETLEGWDAASTSIVEKNKVVTFGSTDPRVDTVDQAQYDAGGGPCVDALDGHSRYWPGDVDDPRWRRFAEQAAACDFYSVVSFPLTLEGRILGALNFYSSEREALRPGQREEGFLFAGQAAVAVANARELGERSAQVEHLEEGLRTRTMIGQATGLLMAQEGLTSEEAFQKLVEVSQSSNIKLRDIAQKYVESWEEKTKRGTAPSSSP